MYFWLLIFAVGALIWNHRRTVRIRELELGLRRLEDKLDRIERELKPRAAEFEERVQPEAPRAQDPPAIRNPHRRATVPSRPSRSAMICDMNATSIEWRSTFCDRLVR
jgi:hypothetical protein